LDAAHDGNQTSRPTTNGRSYERQRSGGPTKMQPARRELYTTGRNKTRLAGCPPEGTMTTKGCGHAAQDARDMLENVLGKEIIYGTSGRLGAQAFTNFSTKTRGGVGLQQRSHLVGKKTLYPSPTPTSQATISRPPATIGGWRMKIKAIWR